MSAQIKSVAEKKGSQQQDSLLSLLSSLQVYPTATRALGLGTSSGMARVGALITPFVAQVTPFTFLV